MAKCSNEDCDKEPFRRGLCTTHYSRLLRHGNTETVLKPYGRRIKPTCSVEGCDRVADGGRGFCNRDYQRWVKYGDPTFTKIDRTRTAPERFWPNVNKDGPVSRYRPDLGPCWIWTTATFGKDGYGAFWLDGSQRRAHRIAYAWLVGPIPDSLELDHLCRVPRCVNPQHLEPVTAKVNNHRGMSPAALNLRKTHCKRDHPYDEENTRINKRGSRVCRTCERAASLAGYYKRKAKSAAAA